ncbi:family 65 glycosyl hydrolase [Ornithinimicrobium sp. F0845]|uniref:glycoside hydrolase family 65 protein n=1 Tax=Ornithinimicrobium sp. F0845 TaxID=2926412 RepID=UPI001FF6165C|nr:glycosyl hydrolase family 65 protein [Ornithinimicrobium sp. F0845]MCK0111468.1 family 65 glycosyl hydrolase [Ornithinimicrobium sp. F0845]
MTAPRFQVDPWLVHEPSVDPAAIPVSETVFSLSNGFLGVRGTLDEAEPCEVHGTFLSGVFEHYPLSYPEAGYGDPSHGQAMVSVPDGTQIQLLVDGASLDIRAAGTQLHQRTLDLRAGVLERQVRWRAPSGTILEVRSARLVSLAERGVLAVRYTVRAVDGRAHVVVRSDLAAVVGRPTVEKGDPRVADALGDPLEVLVRRHTDSGGVLSCRTRQSGIGVAAAVGHEVEGAASMTSDGGGHTVSTTIVAELAEGQSLTVTKVVGYAWARESSAESLLGLASAAVQSAQDRGWDGLADAQREVLDGFWHDADVEVEGDPELQQALRYDLFQVFCAAACISDAPVGAKGLTGLGYDGHTFWDIEGFVLPVLTLLRPEAAARLLHWRSSTLDEARHRAGVLGLQGASFAWRTIDGHECSPYWPASTAAMHVNADIALAFWLYGNVTGEPPDGVGSLPVMVETARLWMSVGRQDHQGTWHLYGMTGPDEYTGVVDDNVFTNLMARGNLRRAAAMVRVAPDRAAQLGVTDEEVESWEAAADSACVPFDETLGVHPMNDNFTGYREWRFEERQDDYPIQEHHHYAKIYRRQVLKQADLVQALWWCRDDFTPEQVARDLDYYEARTVRDSSLSAAVQAVVCAQAGHLDLALRYLRESALVDLRDVQGDTVDGLHMAAAAGSWLALVAGLGGVRLDHEDLEIAPALPAALTRTAYRLRWRGCLLEVETTREGTILTLLDGPGPLPVLVDGERYELRADAPVTVTLRDPEPMLPEPRQPVGREPRT